MRGSTDRTPSVSQERKFNQTFYDTEISPASEDMVGKTKIFMINYFICLVGP